MKLHHAFLMAGALVTGIAQASETNSDLPLPGEKWLGSFVQYACEQGQSAGSQVPGELESLNARFERMSTDSTLDNVRLLATFQEEGAECRYSAILLADNQANSTELVNSHAFAVSGNGTCSAGKDVMDRLFAKNVYWYYGHPHRVSLVVPALDTEAICGSEKSGIAVEFVVSGRL